MNDNPSVPSPTDQLTPAEQADHDRSVHDYPDIHFAPTEYVVIDVQRSKIGLVRIWLFALLAFIAMVLITITINTTAPIAISPFAQFALIACTIVLPLLIGTIGASVYKKNTFIVTNERIFAHIQSTPFSQRSQNVEIEHIEDCSLTLNSPLQMLFDYGTIRLSTVSDEQTYLFTYVAQPKEQFRIINHVVQQVDEGAPARTIRKHK